LLSGKPHSLDCDRFVLERSLALLDSCYKKNRVYRGVMY
jgi:hypothetical protein